MRNYIVINGKKAELTEEQLKKLGIEPKRKNPFDRVEVGEKYFIITGYSSVNDYKDMDGEEDNIFHENANYFNDEDFANQVLLHELLNRKLLRYAWDNETEDVEWDGQNTHWYIAKRPAENGTAFSTVETDCHKCNIPHFSKREIASKAIYDVILPFMAEHPEFVW